MVSKSKLESQNKWIAKNREYYLKRRKLYWANNKERMVENNKILNHERSSVVVDEKFVDPKSDPESLFCSPKLNDIVEGKYDNV